MNKVKCVNTVRGFWKALFSENFEEFEFVQGDDNTTEVISNNNKGITKIIRAIVYSRFLDYFGVFQMKRIPNTTDADVLFSYNRFLKSDRPYILALENPLAPVHYCVKRPTYFLTKLRLKKTFSDGNLKAIVCLSRACHDTLKDYYDIPNNILLYQIYPYIKKEISQAEIVTSINANRGKINCLFISSKFNLKGGNELIEAVVKNGWDKRKELSFTIITNLSELDINIKSKIDEMDNVILYDYNFSRNELNKIYLKANIFINLTRMDSFSLVTLEAMKYGCAFITTSMYAIKEMVIENFNGYLISPSFEIWDEKNVKKYVTWKERNRLDEVYCDEKIVDFLSAKLNYLINNREELYNFQMNSLQLSDEKFSEKYIKSQWQEIMKKVI